MQDKSASDADVTRRATQKTDGAKSDLTSDHFSRPTSTDLKDAEAHMGAVSPVSPESRQHKATSPDEHEAAASSPHFLRLVAVVLKSQRLHLDNHQTDQTLRLPSVWERRSRVSTAQEANEDSLSVDVSFDTDALRNWDENEGGGGEIYARQGGEMYDTHVPGRTVGACMYEQPRYRDGSSSSLSLSRSAKQVSRSLEASSNLFLHATRSSTPIRLSLVVFVQLSLVVV